MLEVMLYHYTAVKESKGLLIEIVDYCYKKMLGQLGRAVQKRLRERKEKQDRDRQKTVTSEQEPDKSDHEQRL
jgi:hypothetical protein